MASIKKSLNFFIFCLFVVFTLYTFYQYTHTPHLEQMEISKFYRDANENTPTHDTYKIMEKHNTDINIFNSTFRNNNLVTLIGSLVGLVASLFTLIFFRS